MSNTSIKPLEGLLVLEFSQYLSGPSAGLRLADMGARVIKIERPGVGDACRKLAIKNLWADDGNSLLFHTINRNKESFAADLKKPEDLAMVKDLIKKADIITHNFRPGIMEKSGLDYEAVRMLNPRVIYAAISGYGKEGPWKDKPGQDLLIQSMSGLVWTSGNAGDNPMPFGISIADIICGAQLVQGILAALFRRYKTGLGALVEVSMMESLLDFQFELLTTYFSGGKLPQRSEVSNANPLLGAPYGVYATADGFISIAMVNMQKLAEAIHCEPLKKYNQDHAFSKRDEIKNVLAQHVKTQPTSYWVERLHGNALWAMEVMNWKQLTQHEAYQQASLEQVIKMTSGSSMTTTRCPIRIDGELLLSERPAPTLGADNANIIQEFLSSAS